MRDISKSKRDFYVILFSCEISDKLWQDRIMNLEKWNIAQLEIDHLPAHCAVGHHYVFRQKFDHLKSLF